jgi:hypothetical protein
VSKYTLPPDEDCEGCGARAGNWCKSGCSEATPPSGEHLDALASNLVIAAALCRAFWLGDSNGLFYMDENHDTWRPGCGKACP